MKYTYNTDMDVVLSNMIEIDFVDGSEDGFLKVRETLQRMGLPNRKRDSLTQTCHLLHKRGRYYICHFLELFALDGRSAELTEGDIGRRNRILKYLVDWELVTPISENWKNPISSPKSLKVIKYGERDKWNLVQKYDIGVISRD